MKVEGPRATGKVLSKMITDSFAELGLQKTKKLGVTDSGANLAKALEKEKVVNCMGHKCNLILGDNANIVDSSRKVMWLILC